jgi:hypothetical protein
VVVAATVVVVERVVDVVGRVVDVVSTSAVVVADEAASPSLSAPPIAARPPIPSTNTTGTAIFAHNGHDLSHAHIVIPSPELAGAPGSLIAYPPQDDQRPRAYAQSKENGQGPTSSRIDLANRRASERSFPDS